MPRDVQENSTTIHGIDRVAISEQLPSPQTAERRVVALRR
jgi:hypothetical protein